MRRALRGFVRFYGANPMHLLALLGSFALIGYVVYRLYPSPSWSALVLWFVGAVVAHDLLLYPLYALADRGVVAGRWARRRLTADRPPRVPAVNHVRVPVVLAALLALITWPTVLGRGQPVLLFAAGIPPQDHLTPFLAVVAVLFLGSAVLYALRLRRAPAAGATPEATRPGPASPRVD